MSFDNNGFVVGEFPKEDQGRSGYPVWFSNAGNGGHQMFGFPPMDNLMAQSETQPIASTSHVDSTTQVTNRTKRIRTAFTAHQLQVLEDAFFKCHYVTRSDRVELAQNLGLKDKAIKVWFQNRRMRYKKEGHRVDYNVYNEVRNESLIQDYQANINGEFINIESKNVFNNSEYFEHNAVFSRSDQSSSYGDMQESKVDNAQDAVLQGESFDKIGSLVAQCITDTEQYAGSSSDDVIELADGNTAGQLNLAKDSQNPDSWKQVYQHQFKNYNINYVN